MIRSFRTHLRGTGLSSQLIRRGFSSGALQVVRRILALAMGVVLARSLGAESYGVYVYAMATMGLLLVIAEAGVPALLMREVAASLARSDWGVLRGALVRGAQLVLLAATVVSGCGLLVLWSMGAQLDSSQLYTMILTLLLLPLVALSRAIEHALRGLGRVIIAQALEMLLRPAFVLITVLVLFSAWPALRLPQYAMAAFSFGVCIVLIISAVILHSHIPKLVKLSKPKYYTRNWLKSALPFTLIGGAGIINNQADILMLGWFRGSEEVGVYRVAVQGASLVAFGLQAANGVIAPQFARLYAQSDMVRLQRLATISARVIFSVALPIAFTLILAGGTAAAFVFGDEFSTSHLPMAILAGAQLVNAAFGSVGFLLNMTGHENDSARILWLTALVNLALNALLIPLYGMAGAAVASAVSLVLWNVCLYRIVRLRIDIKSSAI